MGNLIQIKATVKVLTLTMAALILVLPSSVSALLIGSTTRVSTTTSGDQTTHPENSSGSTSPAISLNGRYIAFSSSSNNLVSVDNNGSKSSVFLKDLQTNETRMISIDPSGNHFMHDAGDTAISGDGQYVAFWVNGHGDGNVYVRDTLNNVTTLVSSGAGTGFTGGRSPSISSDGKYITFQSSYPLVSKDSNNFNDIYVYDIEIGITTLLSENLLGQSANNHSAEPAISSDGRYVTFKSAASNLVDNDTNAEIDIFVKDLVTGNISRASTSSNGEEANGSSHRPTITSDGRYLAFVSFADNLVNNDTNQQGDSFRKDMHTGIVSRVSESSQGQQGNGSSNNTSISPDGRYVSFENSSSNLVKNDTNGLLDIFWKDTVTGRIERINVNSNGQQSNDDSFMISKGVISADGHKIVFTSSANNLVPNDTNRIEDVFVHKVVQDSSSPIVVGVPNREANSDGWYNTDVLVDWQSSDPGVSSGQPTDPTDTLASTEGYEVEYISDPSCDPVGQCAVGKLKLSIDKTKPTVSYVLNSIPNSNGWHSKEVVVSFQCNDALSGVKSCSSPAVLNEGADQAAEGEAVDVADNTETIITETINIDKTAGSTINGAIDSNFITAFNRTVTISADAFDALSGVFEGEYYVDTDPGQGNGVKMMFSNGKVSKTGALTGLSTGQHTLYIRSVDKAGNWSGVTSISFYYL